MKPEEYSLLLTLQQSRNSLRFFQGNIFPLSFNPSEYKPAAHLLNWGDIFQYNKDAAILSARKHLKSTGIYSLLMWLLLHQNKDLEILYLSYKIDMAQYHTSKLKQHIRRNIFFQEFRDLTQAESVLKYENRDYLFTIEPEGILSFKRGRHPDIVVCDDILMDPSQELNLTVIEKITRTFFEDVMSLPKEGGRLFLVGTSQHPEDLFWKIKERNKGINWSKYPAILDEANKKVLWPEMFPYERLVQIRDEEIGEKAFNKEYMCSPVWSEDAYFKREELMAVVDKLLKNFEFIRDPDVRVTAGYDIGKVQHPSHFTVFMDKEGIRYQVYQEFMDSKDYTWQIERIKMLAKNLNISRIAFDDTRGELESFFEAGIISRSMWIGVKFNQQEKFDMAANFGRIVRKAGIRLQNDPRMLRSILSVTSQLEALETTEGHGDAFWSIALALSLRQSSGIAVAGAGRFK